MKGKIKNLWEKIKKISLIAIVLAIYGALFIGTIAFGLGFCALVLGCAIGFGIPAMLVKGIVGFVKQKIEIRNLRKEMLNDLQKHYQEQQDYATKRVESIQKIESQNGNILYAEEYIPCDDKTLEMIKEARKKDKRFINRANALKVMDSYELTKYKVATTVNKEELTQLKQELTLLSFQLQDIAARYNTFLKDKTIEEMYDSRKDLIRLRTKRKAANKD